MDNKLAAILKEVDKPARYTGGEVGVYPVNTEMRVRFCLCYPGLYEEGMAKPDVRIAYHMLNDKKGYSAERCFAPALDMALALRKAKLPLFSLETKTPLDKFHLLGFAFSDELGYTNLLYMLELAGLSPEAAKRKNTDPLVFGFSSCMYSPEPLAAFLDFAIVGDYEDVLIKVIDTVMKARLSNLSKAETLKLLSSVDGVYVFSLMNFTFGKDKRIASISGKTVKRQFVRDLDRAFFPTKLIVPNVEAAFDGAFIEIMRGCEKGCRFCQEGYTRRPVRERRVQNLVTQATAQMIDSCPSTLEIFSLDASSFKRLSGLLGFIDPLCAQRGVKWRVANHHQDSFDKQLLAMANLDEVAIAVEAGSQRLRDAINKDLDQESIESMLKSAFSSGLSKLRLSFLVGLPTESTNDIVSIIDLAMRAQELYREYGDKKKELQLTIAATTFIPKPFTPFQWENFADEAQYAKRRAFLAAACEKIGARFEGDDYNEAKARAILLRGDRRLSSVIMAAYKAGGVLGDYEAFLRVCKERGVDGELYLGKKDLREVLPWDGIDMGLSKKFFVKEYQSSREGGVTPSCSHTCSMCGLEGLGVCKYGRN